jgi:AraC-like DNA-binding protein
MGKLDEDINYLDKVKVKRGDNVEIRYTLLDYNHFFSPVYTVSCDGQSWETALSSMTCKISRIHTYVDIQYLPCGQAKHLMLKASVRWPYLVAVASVVLVMAALYVFRRKEEPKKHDVIEFEIDKVNFTSPDEELLHKAMDVIQKHISDADFKQDDFIKEMGTSRTMLTEKLKELTGFTPISLIMEVRLKTAYNTIMSAQEKLRISDVAYSVGFNDAKYFGTCFRKKYGLTPKELMNQRLEAIKDKADQ